MRTYVHRQNKVTSWAGWESPAFQFDRASVLSSVVVAEASSAPPAPQTAVIRSGVRSGVRPCSISNNPAAAISAAPTICGLGQAKHVTRVMTKKPRKCSVFSPAWDAVASLRAPKLHTQGRGAGRRCRSWRASFSSVGRPRFEKGDSRVRRRLGDLRRQL